MPKSNKQNKFVTNCKGNLCSKPIKLISSKDGIEFGKFCAIGPNLKIIGINHDYNYPVMQGTFYEKYFSSEHPMNRNSTMHNKGKIKIGNDVWIGEDVLILSGVCIGDGCIIGARSVVTKDLKPYTICVGTPCREIKKRYNEEIIDFLLKLKWWNWDKKKIMNNKTFFNTNLNDHDLNYIKKIIV